MKQSKRQSMYETIISTMIVFVVSLISVVVIFPVFDIHTSFGTDFIITVYFTVISILRGYFVRRYFNSK
jgi:hypothetical protein